MKQRIEEKLRENLHPKFLEIKNNSHLHRGHVENSETGETHFAILIESDELNNLSKMQAHRKINQLLKDEFAEGLHALEVRVILAKPQVNSSDLKLRFEAKDLNTGSRTFYHP